MNDVVPTPHLSSIHHIHVYIIFYYQLLYNNNNNKNISRWRRDFLFVPIVTFFLWPSYICLQKRCLRRKPKKIPNKKVASKSGPYVNSSDISILAEDMLVREIYRERARAKFTRLRGTFTFCIESSFATVFTKQSHHRSHIDLLSGVAEKASESSLHTAIPHATWNLSVR